MNIVQYTNEKGKRQVAVVKNGMLAAAKQFAAQVVELAFVKDRIDRGFADARVTALFDEETQALRAMQQYSPSPQPPGRPSPRRMPI